MTVMHLESLELAAEQDRKYYTEEVENPAITNEFEGGYVATRPRHNRNPLRRTWTFGYTDVSATDKALLEGFYNDQKGGSKIWVWLNWAEYQGAAFDYTLAHPGTSMNDAYAALDPSDYFYNVRFTDTMKFTPKGYGFRLRFDCESIKIQEA